MGRASIVTWLPLDDFATIFGWDPLAFNQLSSQTFRRANECGAVTFQYDWQNAERIGRESVALAIQEAEREIAAELGYNLIPDWTTEERLQYPRPGDPAVYGIGVNPRWMGKSVETPRGFLISGGVKAKSLIQAGAAVVRSDLDTDTFQETCTVTVPTTVTDINEIRAYYPGQSGDDSWEIRPIKVQLSGANAIITFKIWQIVAGNQLDSLNPSPIDADTASNFETTIDVYRVYNDPATQAQLIWEPAPVDFLCCGSSSCVACQLNTQAACLHFRDARMGFVVPSPGSWNATDQQFDFAALSMCREPDQVRLWYLSGLKSQRVARPMVEMDPFWKSAVAYYAASKLNRDVCGCSNVAGLIGKWRQDMAYISSGMNSGSSYQEPVEIMANHFGTTAGAIYAYKRVQQNGMKINK